MSFFFESARVLGAGLPAALAQLALAVAVLAVAWGVGRGTLGLWAVARPEVDADDPELAPVWAGVGFAVLGMAGFVLGSVGWLGVVGMGVVAGATGVVGVVSSLRSATAGRPEPGRFGLWGGFALGLGALALLPVALLGVYPPHHVDDLTYHLPYVEAFADTGRMPFLPELLYPVFPQLAEVLWVPLYQLLGPRGATATNLAHGLLVLWVLLVWGRRLGGLGGSRLGAAAGLWTMAAWLGILELAATGATAHTDVALTSFIAVAAWAVGRSRTEPGSAVWVVAAGLAAGAAAATKLHGLVMAPLLALPWVWDLVRRRGDRLARLTSARRLAVYALVALAFAAPWTGRIAALTGSPVFPFYPPPFESPEDLQPFVRVKADHLGATPAPLTQRVIRDLPDIPRLALELTVTGRRSDGRPPLSPWLLLLVPLAVPALLRSGSGRWVVAPVACYLAVWFVTYRDPRYLMPAVAIVLPFVIAGAGIGRWVPRWLLERRAAAAAVACVLALPGLAYGLYRLDALGPLPTTPQERDLFLETRVEGYPLLDDLERHRPDAVSGAVYVLGHPRLRYFVPGRALGERRSLYRHRLVLDRIDRPDELADLLAEWGVTHLLITGRFPRAEPSARLELLHDEPAGAIYHLRTARNAPPPDP